MTGSVPAMCSWSRRTLAAAASAAAVLPNTIVNTHSVVRHVRTHALWLKSLNSSTAAIATGWSAW